MADFSKPRINRKYIFNQIILKYKLWTYVHSYESPFKSALSAED